MSLSFAPSAARKVGAAVCAVLAGAIVASGWTPQPWLYAVPSALSGVVLVVVGSVAVFLAWAISRPLRGPGYAAIVVLVVLRVAWYFGLTFVVGALYASGSWVLVSAVFVLADAAILIVTIICAIFWSKASERHTAVA